VVICKRLIDDRLKYCGEVLRKSSLGFVLERSRAVRAGALPARQHVRQDESFAIRKTDNDLIGANSACIHTLMVPER